MRDKLSILFFCLLCCPTFLFSQQTQDYVAAVASRDYKIEKKSAIYTELLGNSLTGISINFDRIVKQFDESFLNITAGFGFNSGHGSYYATPQ